jgi:hypothetical protein
VRSGRPDQFDAALNRDALAGHGLAEHPFGIALRNQEREGVGAWDAGKVQPREASAFAVRGRAGDLVAEPDEFVGQPALRQEFEGARLDADGPRCRPWMGELVGDANRYAEPRQFQRSGEASRAGSRNHHWITHGASCCGRRYKFWIRS